MPHIKINAVGCKAVPEDGQDLRTALTAVLAGCPRDARIVLMVHGYKYSPLVPHRDPHRLILSPDAPLRGRGAISWPRRLSGARHRKVLTIGFGWAATGSIWSAMRQATQTSAAFSEVLQTLGELTDRPLGILAHSLGAHVVLSALKVTPRLCRPPRVVLLAGAAFRSEANGVAGSGAEVINIISRENSFFDGMFRLANLAARGASPTIGRRGPDVPEWVDLRIDDPDTLTGLRRLGHRLTLPKRRMCHWFGYRRPGIFRLHRALLTADQPLKLSQLCSRPTALDHKDHAGTLSLSPRTPSFGATRIKENTHADRALLLAHAKRLQGFYRARRNGPAV